MKKLNKKKKVENDLFFYGNSAQEYTLCTNNPCYGYEPSPNPDGSTSLNIYRYRMNNGGYCY